MKKLGIIIFLVGLCMSCTEDEFETDQTQDFTDTIRVVDYGTSGRSLSSNIMLSFPDVKTFKQVIVQLEDATESYDDAFMNRWGHLSEEDLDNKEDELNYNPDEPILNYIAQYRGFYSLFQDIRAREEIFLNRDVDFLDDLPDPDDHYVFDDGMRALLNVKGQVEIGGKIFQMTRYGHIAYNGDKSPDVLEDLNNLDMREALNIPNNTFFEIDGDYFGSPSAENDWTTYSCKTGITRTNYFYPATKRRISAKQKLAGYSNTWGTSIKAKTVHFKKIGSRWKRRRGNITAAFNHGFLLRKPNETCNPPITNNIWKTKTRNRRQVKVKETYPPTGNYSFRTGFGTGFSQHKRHSSTHKVYFWN